MVFSWELRKQRGWELAWVLKEYLFSDARHQVSEYPRSVLRQLHGWPPPVPWPLPPEFPSTGTYATFDPSCPYPHVLDELFPLLTWPFWMP